MDKDGIVWIEGAWRVCYNMTVYKAGDLWRVESPLAGSLLVFVFQLITIMVVNRALMIALKPLHQPRIVADILGGVLVGPSVVGMTPWAYAHLVPFRNMLTLETLGNLGLVYYMFLVGLELDFKPVLRSGMKPFSIALVGVIISFHFGMILHSFVFLNDFTKYYNGKDARNGPIFWGIALSTTNFPDLARILADAKLLNSEVGRISLSAAVISDLFSWFLLALAMTTATVNYRTALLSSLGLVMFCVFVVRPALLWLVRCTENIKDSSKNEKYSELLVCFVLSCVVLLGYISDMCGSHSIVGPFVLGAIMPKGDLKKMLHQRIQYFVSMLMIPVFFLLMGLRTNTKWILIQEGPVGKNDIPFEGTSIYRVVAVVVAGFATKIVTTFLTGLINSIPPWDSLAIGILMNTKGLLALIVLSSAMDIKVLDTRSFSMMVVVLWMMTVPVGPFLALSYKPTKRSRQYKLRNIQSVGPETELKILICTHTSGNVSGIIDLIEASNPSKQSPICVFALQLVELTGHASAMIIVHDACKPSISRENESQSEFIAASDNAFENYAQQRENVYAQTLTAVSAYNTMHEDIKNLAEEKCASLIIIPFHMQANIDGAMEETNSSLKDVNNKVLGSTPCSVGVFVDRGLSVSQISESVHNTNSVGYRHFAMFFIGGADDREALTYAWRMAGHPRVNLTVVRFNITPNKDQDNNSDPTATGANGQEKQLDEIYVNEFRLKTIHKHTIQFLDEVVDSWEETLNLIRNMDGEYDLYIVGRRHGRNSPSTSFSDYCNDSYELGPFGDALVSSNFAMDTSVLVMQQGTFVEDELEGDNASVI